MTGLFRVSYVKYNTCIKVRMSYTRFLEVWRAIAAVAAAVAGRGPGEQNGSAYRYTLSGN